jgi:hypothetical protein
VDATTAMSKLVEQRERADDRVREIEAEQRLASQTLVAAREALVQSERRAGGRHAAERRQLEQQLAEAKTAANAPWIERIEGARRHVRDKQGDVVAYVNEHLTELVATLEEEGDAVIARLHAHVEGIVAAYVERERLANGVTLPEAAMLARHANPTVTLTIYAGVTDGAREAAVGKLLGAGFGA